MEIRTKIQDRLQTQTSFPGVSQLTTYLSIIDRGVGTIGHNWVNWILGTRAITPLKGQVLNMFGFTKFGMQDCTEDKCELR